MLSFKHKIGRAQVQVLYSLNPAARYRAQVDELQVTHRGQDITGHLTPRVLREIEENIEDYENSQPDEGYRRPSPYRYDERP